MAKPMQLVITFDPQSGATQVQGPIDHTFWCMGALAEAGRVIQRRAHDREAAKKNGSAGHDIILAPADALPPFREP